MKWPDRLKQSDVMNELCRTCHKERRRPGSAYGERCARIHKGLPVPKEIKPVEVKKNINNIDAFSVSKGKNHVQPNN